MSREQDEVFCSECGQSVDKDSMVNHGFFVVCADCYCRLAGG